MNSSSFYARQQQIQHGLKEDGYANKPLEGDFLKKKLSQMELEELNKKYKAEIKHLTNLSEFSSKIYLKFKYFQIKDWRKNCCCAKQSLGYQQIQILISRMRKSFCKTFKF